MIPSFTQIRDTSRESTYRVSVNILDISGFGWINMEIPVRFHKDCKSGSGNSGKFFRTFNFMGCSNKSSSRMNLGSFTNLECKTVFWDIDFIDFSFSGESK
jgi:hypothetical protein